jgi:hypothetical protein
LLTVSTNGLQVCSQAGKVKRPAAAGLLPERWAGNQRAITCTISSTLLL